MLKIRLARHGKKHAPCYRVVVIEAKSRREGRGVATLGYWNPKAEEFKIDKKAYVEWKKKGAWPTERVKSLVEGGGKK